MEWEIKYTRVTKNDGTTIEKYINVFSITKMTETQFATRERK